MHIDINLDAGWPVAIEKHETEMLWFGNPKPILAGVNIIMSTIHRRFLQI
jgi:hypothetical protein